ncbi:hypothetical protein CBR_g8644 [Chara braunii]|uniref:Uncharacterized protein n=1 Tax=Chara braunii TaxID=69332 RepID=A0A388JS31_CHABU|nr:hypothetical protein CBR_g8644 [Chara braunii]|eukprot:GBG60624.1 hypothetical protein CBR_g8644 [Chara braunii]
MAGRASRCAPPTAGRGTVPPVSSSQCASPPRSGILRNRYWILRHGRSIPNEKGVVVSSLENGVRPENGLAPVGIEQAKEAGKKFIKELKEEGLGEADWANKVHIVSSPFSRTLDTSTAVMQVFPVKVKFEVIPELRERYFGPAMELQSADKWYPVVWQVDRADYCRGPEGGESVVDVAIRMAGVVARLEKELKGCAILLVSHGDPLQIIQAACKPFKDTQLQSSGRKQDGSSRPQLFDGLLNCINQNGQVGLSCEMGKSLARHRDWPLETAELRRLL